MNGINKTRIALCSILILIASCSKERKAVVVAHKNTPYHDRKGDSLSRQSSPHIKLKSIGIGDCQWTEGFWADKFKVAEEVMVPHMGDLLSGEVGHALNNFKIAAGMMEGKHKGMHWHDGDFYKWMEASIYIYAVNKDEKIINNLDEIIDIIGKAQLENGYLQTQITIPGNRAYSERKFHEMYNSGHLMTSACVHHRVTGKTNFLDIAIKNADYLYQRFQPQPEQLARFGYNQTQIIGLVDLYRTTKDNRYLELAEIFINMRGKSKPGIDPTVRHTMLGDQTQERTPFREEDEAVGHAVLALYYYAGAADVFAETGEKALSDALDRIWSNVANKKMYVTGACGQAHDGGSSNRDFVHEAFTIDYMMPNSTAYNETCASVCNAMFNYRMLGLNGEAKHADIMELVLHNSALSGISVEGKDYFYTNPLRRSKGHKMGGTDYATRVPYIPCFCCPPNLVRTIAKSPIWAYSLTNKGLVVNLYGGNKLTTKLLDGSEVELSQQTNYPWEGRVTINVEKCKKTPFEIQVRIPGWAEGSTLLVNGKNANVEITNGQYAKIEREWKKGDVITLNMPMDIQLVEGHPRIEEVRNQVAVKRGPIVYCVESPDLPENSDILDVYISKDANLKAKHKPDLLGGVTTIDGEVMLRSVKGEGMYRKLKEPEWKSIETSFVPYFAWSNRGESEMTVWVPIVWN